MIHYYASKQGDLKGLLPLESIGKTKDQHCHKTKEEAIIYMLNPNFSYDSRQKTQFLKEFKGDTATVYLYRCEKQKGENAGYNKDSLAKIIAKEVIEDVKEYLVDILNQ